MALAAMRDSGGTKCFEHKVEAIYGPAVGCGYPPVLCS
jgi:hypothetical protein